jgi:hypothetical protein
MRTGVYTVNNFSADNNYSYSFYSVCDCNFSFHSVLVSRIISVFVSGIVNYFDILLVSVFILVN